mgnify:CR=1 FL=1
MTLWYAEQLTPASASWTPVTFPARPEVDSKTGRQVLTGSIGPRLRGLCEVQPQHEGLHLGRLAAIYGTSASADSEPMSDTIRGGSTQEVAEALREWARAHPGATITRATWLNRSDTQELVIHYRQGDGDGAGHDGK